MSLHLQLREMQLRQHEDHFVHPHSLHFHYYVVTLTRVQCFYTGVLLAFGKGVLGCEGLSYDCKS